ncbi:hypothetical protein [Streptomyces sp. MZ04]|uniref:hypothetical protein n=1 Tax=Streptomyces sp. MZ04 TaxID=2559236 RepID=UPI00107E6888|nr:hypothetical protein [Streptomyces sp. MZ04]TGB14533.1 hypothetical protein E2651_05410 [Streptomyces sp. MZ04]
MRDVHRTRLRMALPVLGLLTVPLAAGPLPGAVTPAAAAGVEQAPERDIRARIESLPGMRVTAEKPAAPGRRDFEPAYRQPVDHRHPERGTFEQRLRLLHKSTHRPTVLYTSGYGLVSNPDFRSEPTQLVDGNEIVTEQRYFDESGPNPVDWSKLDIRPRELHGRHAQAPDAYFYQLGTQLGYPQYSTPHLTDLLRHPGVQDVRTYVPRDIPLRFQPHTMADIDRWVRHDGSQLLFVYGENDVATAERFRLGRGSRDAHLYVAPDTNHRARIESLPTKDSAAAKATLRRWAGQ